MNWTRKDWIDLLLMAIGAIVGVAAFGFGAELVDGSPGGFAATSVAGTLCGYVLRFGISYVRPYA